MDQNAWTGISQFMIFHIWQESLIWLKIIADIFHTTKVYNTMIENIYNVFQMMWIQLYKNVISLTTHQLMIVLKRPKDALNKMLKWWQIKVVMPSKNSNNFIFLLNKKEKKIKISYKIAQVWIKSASDGMILIFKTI